MPTANGHAQFLTISTGSSSFEAALYHLDLDQTERREVAAEVERIGRSDTHVSITDAHGTALLDERGELPDHAAALELLFAWLHDQQLDTDLDGVGHRVGHGGSQHTEPELITAELVSALQQLVLIGAGVWPWASTDEAAEPDVVLVCAGVDRCLRLAGRQGGRLFQGPPRGHARNP